METQAKFEKPDGFKCGTFKGSSLEERRFATGSFKGGLDVWDLERMDRPTYSARQHEGIINCIDGVGGRDGISAPELVTGGRDGRSLPCLPPPRSVCCLGCLSARPSTASAVEKAPYRSPKFSSLLPPTRWVTLRPTSYVAASSAAILPTGCVKVWDVRQPDAPVADMAPSEENPRDCWAVAFGNSFDEERCVAAGYDNGDVKLFDLRAMKTRWETNLPNGVRQPRHRVPVTRLRGRDRCKHHCRLTPPSLRTGCVAAV